MEILGRCFFGIAVAASGALQLVTGEFVRLVPIDAAGDGQSPSAWPYVTGVVLLAAGCAIAAERRARLAGGIVAALIAVSLTLAQIPRLLSDPWVGFMWTNPLKAVALLGSGCLLVALLPGGGGDPALVRSTVERLQRLAPLPLALFLIVCGVQHFVYADFVDTLVPSWIPGQRLWTCFTGVALIAGGAGILVPRTSRAAATCSALMIFLWVILLHIPRAVAGPNHAGETAGVFEALAISGVALMVAASRARPD